MTIETPVFNSVKEIVTRIQDILHQMEEVPQLSDTDCIRCKESCGLMLDQLADGCLKIAVVGVIKSGKSTLVNALVGKDLVKRGAGVITSITTRIQKGKKNQATIYFKSWDQINAQLETALRHFPMEEYDETPPSVFDLRRKKDRSILKRAYNKICRDLPVSLERIPPEVRMIQHVLDGFDACQTCVQADESAMVMSGREFERHRDYTSNADKAFYVKDVRLDLYGKVMEPGVEIADCQGADATDPASLENVLTYIDTANLIVYCISSRIGLRRADIRFIRQIKKMGLSDHVLFVNNCDLTEHENLTDLKKITQGIGQDLGYLLKDPAVYTFSCLYRLFQQTRSKLNKKDQGRFQLWCREKEMIRYCESQSRKFNERFNQIVAASRQQYLAANHLSRLEMILTTLTRRTDIFMALLSDDHPKRQAAGKTLKELHTKASRLELIVENSIEGAIGGLKKEIHKNIKTAFVNDEMQILEKSRDFIDHADIDIDVYRKLPGEYGFNRILYLMFQEFRRGLDRFEVEQIKPLVKRFVEIQDEKIRSHFQSLLNSYQIDLIASGPVSDAGEDETRTGPGESFETVDIKRIKEILGLRVPGRIFHARYTSKNRAGLWADFGLHTITGVIASLVNVKTKFSFTPGIKKTASRMKYQTKRRLRPQFEQYRQDIIHLYFTPLIDAATREFKQIIRHRFDHYKSFEADTKLLLDLETAQKKEEHQKLIHIRSSIEATRSSLISLCDKSYKIEQENS